MERWLLLGSLLLSIAIASVIAAHEPEWNPANVKPCDRACLARVMDTYMNAI